LITLATYGVGMLIGFKIAGLITDMYTSSETIFNWKMIWIIPSGIAMVVFLLFAISFNEKKEKAITDQNMKI
jgi:MFS family permease